MNPVRSLPENFIDMQENYGGYQNATMRESRVDILDNGLHTTTWTF